MRRRFTHPRHRSRVAEARYDKATEKAVKQWIAKEFPHPDDKKAATIAFAVVNKYGTKDSDNLTDEYDKKIDRADIGGGFDRLFKILDKVIDYVDGLQERSVARSRRAAQFTEAIDSYMASYRTEALDYRRRDEKMIKRWIDSEFRDVGKEIAQIVLYTIQMYGLEGNDRIRDQIEDTLRTQGFTLNRKVHHIIDMMLAYIIDI